MQEEDASDPVLEGAMTQGVADLPRRSLTIACLQPILLGAVPWISRTIVPFWAITRRVGKPGSRGTGRILPAAHRAPVGEPLLNPTSH